jgi:hypothetical protein
MIQKAQNSKHDDSKIQETVNLCINTGQISSLEPFNCPSVVAGCSVLGAWFLVLGSWFLVLGAWCWVLGAECWVLGAWCLVLGAGCLVLGAWCHATPSTALLVALFTM